MAKKIILAVLIIVIIGTGLYLYFVFTSPPKEKPSPIINKEPVFDKTLPVAPPIERYEFQEIEYEFISVGGSVHDIITGELTEEQVNLLAEKIIADILAKEPSAQEITLLFYSDLVALGVEELDVAEIIWTPEGIKINIIDS